MVVVATTEFYAKLVPQEFQEAMQPDLERDVRIIREAQDDDHVDTQVGNTIL